jgi:acyl carrier protein
MGEWKWLLFVCMLIAAVALAWMMAWPERRFRRELASRAPMDADQFLQSFYGKSEVPPDIPRRLRPIYARFFELDETRLRPFDRPPELDEIDEVELFDEIEGEFGVVISDKDAENIEGSFDSIVQYLTAHTRQGGLS